MSGCPRCCRPPVGGVVSPRLPPVGADLPRRHRAEHRPVPGPVAARHRRPFAGSAVLYALRVGRVMAKRGELPCIRPAATASRSGRAQRRTAAMSRTVRAVPRTVPVTLERPSRGWYATSTSTIRQPRPRPAPPSRAASRIGGPHAERQQRRPAGGPHRAEVAERARRCRRRRLEASHPVGQPGVDGPRPRGRAGAGPAPGRPVVRRAAAATAGRSRAVERAVAVHEAHDRRPWPRSARRSRRRRSPAAARLPPARPGRAATLARAVGRTVVDHDRPVPGGHRRQHPGQRPASSSTGRITSIIAGRHRPRERTVRVLVTGGADLSGRM